MEVRYENGNGQFWATKYIELPVKICQCHKFGLSSERIDKNSYLSLWNKVESGLRGLWRMGQLVLGTSVKLEGEKSENMTGFLSNPNEKPYKVTSTLTVINNKNW